MSSSAAHNSNGGAAEYIRDNVRKLGLWHTRTFSPLATHDHDLDPVLSALGFLGQPPQHFSGVLCKEYVYCGPGIGAGGGPRPRLPYPRIDGLHMVTYKPFVEAVNFYLRMPNVADLFHVRGMPLHRVNDRNERWKRMEDDEFCVFLYRHGTLDQKKCKAFEQESEWKTATATYSKEVDSSLVTGGACGYGDLNRTSYGKHNAGLSSILFERGSSCGVCFEVRCVNHIRWCLPGSPSIFLTATDFCPPNYGLPSDYGGWCNFPREHFEMSEDAFGEIAEKRADIVPVQYRRAKCVRKGGIRFTVYGTNVFYQVLITNVGSDGEVVAVKVKGSKTSWVPMGRNWGQNWQTNINLSRQPLSFEVTTSDGITVTSYNVAPANWRFGQTFVGKQF